MRKEDALSDADWANAKKLTLSSLTLTAIPKALLGAVHLTSLVLDGCSLMTLPDELFALPNVKKMSFKQNFISEIGLQGILNSGKKLSSVAMDKNPLAFPPPAVMAKSWSSVRKWAAANSSYMVYRLLWGSNYVDVTLSGMSDPQTREKDEDRGCFVARLLESEIDIPIAIAEYNKSAGVIGMKRDASIQTMPGWCNAPSNAQSHVLLVQHLFLGLFDGHGGSVVAETLASTLYKEIEKDGGFSAPSSDLPKLLANTFLRVDKQICSNKKDASGSTALALILRASASGPEIITAHVGDTRAMWRLDGKVIGLTVDHELADKLERERVEKRGGVVEMRKGCYRVNKKLGVSRAFGNRRMKKTDPPVIDAEPSVSVGPLLQGADVLVVASDGLWQYVEPRLVFSLLRPTMSAEEGCLAVTEYQIDGKKTQLVEHDNLVVGVAKFAFGSLPTTVAQRLVLNQNDKK